MSGKSTPVGSGPVVKKQVQRIGANDWNEEDLPKYLLGLV
jgi:hypothetical protein